MRSGEADVGLFVVPSPARAAQMSRWATQATRQLDADPTSLWIAEGQQLNPRSVLTAPIWRSVSGARHALIDRLLPTRSSGTGQLIYPATADPEPDDHGLQ